MTQRKRKVVSAQVVLRPAGGGRGAKPAPVTAENVAEYLPSPEAAAAARRAFAAAGFEAGDVVGNSFSITGPARTFERVFGVRLKEEEGRGLLAFAKGAEAGSYELPLGGLPAELARHVEAVTFSPPPDFGPTNY